VCPAVAIINFIYEAVILVLSSAFTVQPHTGIGKNAVDKAPINIHPLKYKRKGPHKCEPKLYSHLREFTLQ
jgi:hypothetical protein